MGRAVRDVRERVVSKLDDLRRPGSNSDIAGALDYLYQPRLRRLLHFLGDPEVQTALVKIGALKSLGTP